MRGLRGPRAEVLGRLHETESEDCLPDSVNRHPGRERRATIGQPSRQGKTVGLRARRQRMQRRRHLRGDHFLRLIPRAAIQALRRPNIRPSSLREVKDRGHRLGVTCPMTIDLVVDRLELLHRKPPRVENRLPLLRSTLSRRSPQRQHRRVRCGGNLRIRGVREGNAEPTHLHVFRAVVIAAVIGHDRDLKPRASRQSKRLLKLHHRHGIRVAPSRPALGAPSRPVVLIDHEVYRAAQTFAVFVPRLALPLRLHAGDLLLEVS